MSLLVLAVSPTASVNPSGRLTEPESVLTNALLVIRVVYSEGKVQEEELDSCRAEPASEGRLRDEGAGRNPSGFSLPRLKDWQ